MLLASTGSFPETEERLRREGFSVASDLWIRGKLLRKPQMQIRADELTEAIVFGTTRASRIQLREGD